MIKSLTYLIISFLSLAFTEKKDIGTYDPKDGPQDLDFEGAKITTDHNAPQKWFGPKEGQAQHYKTEIVSGNAYSGKECAMISSVGTSVENEFGNIMQFIDATPFRGKTVRFRAAVRVESASTARAQMWMRVDTHEPWGYGGGYFDNMQDRPITSGQWKEYEIKGPISSDAKRIYIGCMLLGEGKAFFDAVHFDVLTGKDTVPQEITGPANLDFEEAKLMKGSRGWFYPDKKYTPHYEVKLMTDGAYKGKQYAEVFSTGKPGGQEYAEFGNIMQTFDATSYRGKTMRFRAAVRVNAENNNGRGQMWMRVDRKDQTAGFFDNMSDRPITSGPWKEYDIVGNIDTDAQLINIGCMLIGEGKVDFDAVSFEPTNEKITAPDPSKHWFPAGDNPHQYTMETKDDVRMIKYTSSDPPNGFGTYMHWQVPGEYLGKRLKMTGMIRTENAEDWVGMWCRVDGQKEDEMLDFDNMHDRPIKGTTDWKKYEIITNVPKNASAVSYGVLVTGRGTAYFKDIKFEIIGEAQDTHDHGSIPQNDDLNLGFEHRHIEPLLHNKPQGWYAGGGGKSKADLNGYLGELDSTIVHSGKYSLHLKYIKGDGFGVGTNSIAVDRVRGKTIRYNGWIKTKNVEGYAGLWWRVDGPNHKTLAFNNMQDSLIDGTRDWKRYSFELPVDNSATNINFGVLMGGKGEAWFDELSIDTNGVRFLGQ